jgi:choline-glycine betaine transporter
VLLRTQGLPWRRADGGRQLDRAVDVSGYTALMLALMLSAGVGAGILLIALAELYLYSRQYPKENRDGDE